MFAKAHKHVQDCMDDCQQCMSSLSSVSFDTALHESALHGLTDTGDLTVWLCYSNVIFMM